ncbi:hypothetical protein [Candidatus Magnetominusculus dajiuhuensis]|uniref:hypothetical protein n=1 Tax=Candidatus Magnetominusculus dajiuhuensis TaxID=3137712 RepID=UPI003B42DB52
MILSHKDIGTAVPAKIMPPRLRMALRRRRCFRVIDTALSRPIVWVTAPAGAGKTTLIADYVDTMKIPALWYRLDERDTDIKLFFSYMQEALRIHINDSGIVLPDLVSEESGHIDTFPMLFFDQLFGHLAPPCVLVFDDYQNIPENSVLHKVFIKGLSQLPEGIYVIFIGRDDPPPPFVHFLAKMTMNTIGYGDIRFDLRETTDLVKSGHYHTVPDGAIDRLYNETGGWVTGLILALSQVDRTENPAANSYISKETLSEYFMMEIFDTQPDDIKEFLLKTSWLPEFTVEMAAKIAPQSAGILVNKYKGFFITKNYGNGVFTYWGMFRDFLLNQSEVFYGERLGGIALQAADILEAHGYVGEGMALIVKFRKWERFDNIIAHHVRDITDEGHHAIVDNCMFSIPDEIIQNDPWMLFLQGLKEIYWYPKGARQIFERSYNMFKQSRCSDGQLLALSGVIKAIVIEGRDAHPLDGWIEEFEGTLFEEYNHIKSLKIREGVVSGISAALILRQPGHIGMDYWLEEADKIVLYSKDIEARVFVGCNIIMYYLWSGMTFKAGVIVDVLSLPVRELKTLPVLRLMYLRAEALYFYYKFSPDNVFKAVDEGLLLGSQAGIHVMDSELSGISIYCWLAEGNDKAVEEKLQQISACMADGQSYSPLYYQLLSLVELSKNEFPTAIEYARKSMAMAREYGCHFMMGINKYFMAYVLVESGQYDEAMHQLKDIEGISAITKSELLMYHISSIRALAALKTNDEKQFENQVNKAALFANQSGMRTLLPLQRSVAKVCKAAIDRGIQVEYARELIRLHKITSDDHTMEHFPWAIKLYTLGRFGISVDGKDIKFQGKSQKVPLLLLKTIVSAGKDYIDTGQITDNMWAESDGDSAHKTFNINMYRLRKLLGNKETIMYFDGHLCLNPELCWVDIWAFDDIIEKMDIIKRLGNKSSDEEMMRLFVKMASLYKGDFMPHDGNTWIVRTRERLMWRFINCCLQVGD